MAPLEAMQGLRADNEGKPKESPLPIDSGSDSNDPDSEAYANA